MIYTWAADTAPLLDENRYRAYFEQAPSWRQEKAKKMRFPEDRALSIGAWMLYEKAKKESGLSGENIFNLSHSGHFVLCSIGEDASRKTGCDVEMTGMFRPNVARRFFCPSEWEYIDGRESEEEKRDAFFRYWVLKESFMKATRLGMRLAMNAFEIAVWQGGEPRLIRQPEEIGGIFHFREYDMREQGFQAAVCSEDPDIAVELGWITL